MVPIKILKRFTDHLSVLLGFLLNPLRLFNYFKNDIMKSQQHYFQKIILASTEVSQIIAIDSITGDTIWSLFLDEEQITEFFTVKRTHNKVVGDHLMIVSADKSGSYKIRTCNPFTGELLHIDDIRSTEIKAVLKVPSNDKNDYTVIVNKNFEVEVFPKDAN